MNVVCRFLKHYIGDLFPALAVLDSVVEEIKSALENIFLTDFNLWKSSVYSDSTKELIISLE